MKKLMVVLFLFCLAFGEWQQSGEITLPKGIQVKDLTINHSGEIWILSASSLLKLEASSKNPLLFQEIPNGKVLTARDKIYILDNLNRLIIIDPNKGEIDKPTNLRFNNPRQIGTITADDNEIFIVCEPGQLIFGSTQGIFGAINTSADKFSVIPSANYGDMRIPLFTLANNQIHSWTGGTFKNPKAYKSRLLYSTTHSILDFSVNRDGNVYILFSDSIVVLGLEGNYKRKIGIDNLSPGSKILTNPADNNLIIFNQLTKSLKTLVSVKEDKKGDIITLHKNLPNPVDNYTEIEFTINQHLDLTITIYNLIGESIKVIAKDYYQKGTHLITWNADDEDGDLVPNGVYFYRLESEKGAAIRQLIVLR